MSTKSRQRFRIVPRWEPDQRFALPLHRHIARARSVTEFVPEAFFQAEDEPWRPSAPLQ
jgi:hypothetical protein